MTELKSDIIESPKNEEAWEIVLFENELHALKKEIPSLIIAPSKLLTIEKKEDVIFLLSLRKEGLEIDGINPNCTEIDQDKVKKYFLDMSPIQVYNFRNTIDPKAKKLKKRKYATDNFQKLMKITELIDIKIPRSDVIDSISKTLLDNGNVISVSELAKIDYSREDFFAKITEEESEFKPFAISDTGALGISQHVNYKEKFNPFNWEESIKYKIDLIQDDFRHYGDIKKTIIAYNRGRGYVDRMISEYGEKWYEEMGKDKYGREGCAFWEKIRKKDEEDETKSEEK